MGKPFKITITDQLTGVQLTSAEADIIIGSYTDAEWDCVTFCEYTEAHALNVAAAVVATADNLVKLAGRLPDGIKEATFARLREITTEVLK